MHRCTVFLVCFLFVFYRYLFVATHMSSLFFSQHSATDRSSAANLALCQLIWRLPRERLGNFGCQKQAATNLVTFSALGKNVGTDASTF